MKFWVTRNALHAQDYCPACGLTGLVALRTEQLVNELERPRIWRHSVCGHILAYRRDAATWHPRPVAHDDALFIASHTP